MPDARPPRTILPAAVSISLARNDGAARPSSAGEEILWSAPAFCARAWTRLRLPQEIKPNCSVSPHRVREAPDGVTQAFKREASGCLAVGVRGMRGSVKL